MVCRYIGVYLLFISVLTFHFSGCNLEVRGTHTKFPISSKDSYESSIGRGIPLLGLPEISLQCISRFHRPTPPHTPLRPHGTSHSAGVLPLIQQKSYPNFKGNTIQPTTVGMVLKPLVNNGTNLPTSTRELIRDFWTINSSNTKGTGSVQASENCLLLELYHLQSGQIIMFHQPRFPWNKRIFLTKPPFGVRSCEVAIIWPASIIFNFWGIQKALISLFQIIVRIQEPKNSPEIMGRILMTGVLTS